MPMQFLLLMIFKYYDASLCHWTYLILKEEGQGLDQNHTDHLSKINNLVKSNNYVIKIWMKIILTVLCV